MNQELKNNIDKLLKAPLSKIEQSIALISLSHLAYNKRDMSSYSELVEEIKKINPELVKAFKSKPLTLENLAKTSF